MTDLQTRFQSLDSLRVPNLWPEVEARAAADRPSVTGGRPWVLIGVALMLTLVLGGAVLLASGMKLPITAPSPTGLLSAPTHDPRTPYPAAWIASGNMLEARLHHTATLLLDGRVLVAGGSASAELFDPASGAWTATGSLTEPAVVSVTATLLLDGTVLVLGFQTRLPYRGTAELYEPDSGTWLLLGDPGVRFSDGMTATRLPDGSVLVVDGTAWIYDPRTRSWRTAAPPGEGRHHHAATLLPDGRVLVVGGDGCCGHEDGQDRSLASAELYDPTTGTWSPTGSLAEGRFDLTAPLLMDGTVLVAGGHVAPFGYRQALASSEIYNPVSGTWASAGSLNAGDPLAASGNLGAADAFFYTYTPLFDGTVLAVGGTTAELYEPLRGTWSRTVSPNGLRIWHTATRLADGTVLVVGGESSTGTPVASTELYEPLAGTEESR